MDLVTPARKRIVITRRSGGGWTAALECAAGVTAGGNTPEQAIGDLVHTFWEHFGVEVVYPAAAPPKPTERAMCCPDCYDAHAGCQEKGCCRCHTTPGLAAEMWGPLEDTRCYNGNHPRKDGVCDVDGGRA